MKKLNLVFSVLLIVTSVFFFFYADSFRALSGEEEIGPGAFPKAVCIALCFCSILLIVKEVKRYDAEKAGLFNYRILVGFVVSIFYLFLLKPLGFLIDSFLIVIVMTLLLLTEPLKKAWPILISVSVLVPVALYIVFDLCLKVPLPAGVFSFLG